MTEFTASNGIEITMDPDREGKVYLVGRRARGDEGQYLDTHANAGPEGLVALREFFQHERDEALGRWRFPANPDYVVYPPDADDEEQAIRILFEPGGGSSDMYTREWLASVVDPDTWAPAACAKAYFQAHPERKPWEDAKPGELWIITLDDNERGVSVETFDAGENVFQVPDAESVSLSNPRITGGRKIWPEDAS